MLRSFLLAALMTGLAADAAADEMTDLRTAEAHLRAERWAEAEQILDRLIAANPAQGGYWHYRAVARAGSGRCDVARPDFQRAIALGSFGDDFWVRHALVEDAACASLEGATGQALDRLATARDRYKLTDFTRIDEDARFIALHELTGYARLAGRVTGPALSRNQGWRHDLDWYVELVLARHPDPFHTTPEAVWRAEVERLGRAIPDASDVEIASGFMRLAALIGDGHTSIYPPFEGPLAFSLTPIWP
jgi:tetratricopeptide (TPR) repeat protein